MPELSVAELVGRLQSERTSLVGLMTLLTGDRAAADDLFQETCLEAMRTRATFQPGTDFRAWVRAVARIQALRFLRSRKRGGFLLVNTELVDRLTATWGAESSPDPEAPPPLDRALASCMEALEPEQKRILRWRYGSSWSCNDIARKTARSVDGVKMLFLRLRRRLQKCVQKKLLEE